MDRGKEEGGGLLMQAQNLKAECWDQDVAVSTVA